MICLRVSLFMQNRGNCHICSQALADCLSERDTKMSNYQVQMASIIISSLKGVTSYQRDNTATIDNFHVITPCSLNWMLVLN